jgi:DEAD/DEAH box helicase domain-containing protein
MSVEPFLEALRRRPAVRENVRRWITLPERKARFAEPPDGLHPEVLEALESRGIRRLYTHQREALDRVDERRHVCVVTPTASGKTLCYDVPVLDALAKGEPLRALYLFPTKALSQDQVASLRSLAAGMTRPLRAGCYDGDTPPAERRQLREDADVVVTNPYMLHTGILPNHPKWVSFFRDLKIVVLDEIHTYRGVFGSHMANVVRRLRRIARHYGADPLFLCCSATVGNPGELASRLVGTEVAVVDESGAPSGEKHLLLYNPPVLNRDLGLRASSVEEVRRLLGLVDDGGLQTIVFARTRKTVEVLVKYIRDALVRDSRDEERVRAYRGGYLPDLRRAIESGLRAGTVRTVVATNALELGIDIGGLDLCFLTGYPGSLSSFWQQAGRAGRRSGISGAVLVATSSALDQYLVEHPEYLTDRPRENVVLDPDNLVILLSQLKCAAFELPFRDGDRFGDLEETPLLLEHLEKEQGLLHRAGDQWFWAAPAYPAEGVSLNGADIDNFVILDAETQKAIAEVDRPSAMFFIHVGAVYGHQGETYVIEELDYENRKALARRTETDHFTEAETETALRILHLDEEDDRGGYRLARGDVEVTTQATVYKKIRFYTRENVGAGEIDLPSETMDTEAFWIVLGPSVVRASRLLDGGRSGALLAFGRLLGRIAPLWVRCDPADLRVVAEVKSKSTGEPTVYLHEVVPGGVGLTDRCFEVFDRILGVMGEVVDTCPCDRGCPACVGPPAESGPEGKLTVAALVRALRGHWSDAHDPDPTREAPVA